MEVKQIYNIVNDITKEILGEETVLQEDLSNVVDIGNEIFNAADVDSYVRSLVNHIGKVIFVNRPYAGGAPSVLMDGWEWGSVLEKVSADLPTATENESWELVDGASYDPNIFYQPKVSAKFFNKKTTFEIPCSFTERQVKQSFSNAEQLNGFISMIYNAVDKSMTVKIDGLIMRTINNFTAEVLLDGSAVQKVNLLAAYNVQFGETLTAADALTNQDFIKYASYQMSLYESRMSKISSLFNLGEKDRFTPADRLHIVMLADFKKAADIYLQSGVYHNELTKLPNAETVPYWQGSGLNYGFSDISKINVKTATGSDVVQTGIIGVMFDRDALGVVNLDRRTTSNYNPKAEFYNEWFKFEAGYFNDFNENFVVFYIAD